MHAGLNCEQVFEVLTEGPFPRGKSDDAYVEMHLRGCHECRCLAEALRPAVDLLHESLNDETPLPGYRGQLEADSDAMVQRVMDRVSDQENRRQRGTWSRLLPWAVSLAVVVCFCLAMSDDLWGVRDAGSAPVDFEVLAEATVSSCLLQESEATDFHGRYQCCTFCHTAERGRDMRVATVLQACVECHTPP